MDIGAGPVRPRRSPARCCGCCSGRVRGSSRPIWCSSGLWCVATSTGGALPQANRTGGGMRGLGEPFPVTRSGQHHRSTRLSWSSVAGERHERALAGAVGAALCWSAWTPVRSPSCSARRRTPSGRTCNSPGSGSGHYCTVSPDWEGAERMKPDDTSPRESQTPVAVSEFLGLIDEVVTKRVTDEEVEKRLGRLPRCPAPARPARR